MAAARQCDICRQVYPLYNTGHNGNKPNGMMFLNIDSIGKYWTNDKIDCCPGCMKSIQHHIELLKSGGE